MAGRRLEVALAAAVCCLSFWLFFGFVTPAAGVPVRRVVLGHSVEGRPIVAYEVGDPRAARRELVVGCVHGDERAGIAIARRLEHASPTGLDLWVVPVLNPDGAAARTRGNARGVDLNRNFPWRWKALGGAVYSGRRPLSEPESKIAYRLIRRLRPQVSIWFHQPQDVVDESGGSKAVERRFASAVGFPLARLPREPGSVVGWENHILRSSTAFVVELPDRRLSMAAVGRFAQAAVAVGRGYVRTLSGAGGRAVAVSVSKRVQQ
ncbi:MAG TPA: M14 family zinc carboxypeptidase [Gaiellaceae bacterium]|nr:M14 family zinc carboxypeptidase [Gaiellaceae bacterium]